MKQASRYYLFILRRPNIMSKSKNRRENADKIRKQTPHPHGHIASLKQLSDQ